MLLRFLTIQNIYLVKGVIICSCTVQYILFARVLNTVQNFVLLSMKRHLDIFMYSMFAAFALYATHQRDTKRDQFYYDKRCRQVFLRGGQKKTFVLTLCTVLKKKYIYFDTYYGKMRLVYLLFYCLYFFCRL